MNSNQQLVVQRALEVMQRRGRPVGQTVEISRICAIHAAAYSAMYRNVNGLWRHEGCVKASGKTASGHTGGSLTIDVNAIEADTTEICPWCGCGPKVLRGISTIFVECGLCGNNVCLGRSSGDTFRCCGPCGAVSSITEPLQTTTATLRLARVFGLAAGGSRPALAGRTLLRLTAGSNR
jgi:hypothetical protein